MADKKKKKTWPRDIMPDGAGLPEGKAPSPTRQNPRSTVTRDMSQNWPFGKVRVKADRADEMTVRARPKTAKKHGEVMLGGWPARKGERYVPQVDVKTPKYVAKDQLVDANKRAHKVMSSKMQENEKKRKASDSARANKRRAGGSRFKGR